LRDAQNKKAQFLVRLATSEDQEALVAFQRCMASETEGKGLSLDTLQEGVAGIFSHPERGFYIVAETGGAVIAGLLVTYEWSDWRAGNFWWVQSVFVDSGWRRRGVYRAMYDQVRQLALAQDKVCGLRLYVDQDNESAHRTYESLGMHRTRYHLYETELGKGSDA
jgi:GNAT superfamily N-acetyltransferase